MRNPVRSETDALYMAVGTAVVVAVSLALGALLAPLVGVALCLGAVAGAFIWEIATTDGPSPAAARGGGRGAAQHARTRPGERILVGEALRAELVGRVQQGAEVHVVVPIVASRIHHVASDIDAELREARERLDETLGWARAEGLQLTGRVGHPSTALGAIEDELRLWAPRR